MDSFLHHIADQFRIEKSDSLKDTCFVFPSRRASLYLDEILKNQNSEIPFWAPTTFSIEEFVQQHSPDLLLADPLQLILKLYEIYKKHGGSENFDEFYNWGRILLSDFDQLDRYLVDGKKVYRNLQEIDDLEATFGPSEELIKALNSFKKIIDDGKEGRLTQNFIENWQLVGKIYAQLKEELQSTGKGYMGMIYRQLAERVIAEKIKFPYKKIVFAGFNALSTAEQLIIDKLLETGLATVYFDADRYYLDDDNEEAGHFLRKNRRKWYRHPEVHWVVTDGFNTSKKIDIIGLEQQVSQVRAASELLETYGKESTAIVMGDESLISPLLYALPDPLDEVNITMGFPVAGSSLANLTRAYFKYQETITTSKAKKTYVNRISLDALISQPALGNYLSKEFYQLRSGKSAFVPIERVEGLLNELDDDIKELIASLFAPQDDIVEAIECFINYLSQEYYKSKEANTILVNGIRVSLLRYLKELKTEFSSSSLSLTYGVLDKLLRESFKQLSTPFSGEPLAQLQVMGFLESRTLDFKNLILLSVNEDTIPASSGANSYIPFNVRKAFGLPTFLDQNSIYAYHFFRLLQRAENVTLIYSTELSVTGAGEQSRFIYQLMERTRIDNSPANITRKFWSPAIPEVSTEVPKIEIAKTKPVQEQIAEHFKQYSDKRSLSPTQLTDYITCSLKYYLARILRISEPDEESEKIDARVFGNLLHETLETCYTPWIGKSISSDEIKHLIDNLPHILDEVFKGYDHDNGETRFAKNLVFSLSKTILQNDLKDAPIFIHDLESKSTPLRAELKVSDSLAIKIGGLIDRLDMINVDGQEVHRVLDYKTGKSELRSLSFNRKPISDEDYVAAHFTDPKFKSGFQLLFYMLILKLNNPGWQLNGGIIGVRKVNTGIDYLRKSKEAVSPSIIQLYAEELRKLILEITNPEIPFSQTEDLNNCTYCQFRRICRR